jgi:hypothetical protein
MEMAEKELLGPGTEREKIVRKDNVNQPNLKE